MSLSPLVSFKSRFVTYLLNFPRTFCMQNKTCGVETQGKSSEMCLN